MSMFTEKVIMPNGENITITGDNEEETKEKARKLKRDMSEIKKKEEEMIKSINEDKEDNGKFEKRLRIIPKVKVFFFNLLLNDGKKEENIEGALIDWIFNLHNDNVEILSTQQSFFYKDNAYHVMIMIWYKERPEEPIKKKSK